MLDVGQANELKLAFRRAGYSNADIKRLCEEVTLADFRKVLYGLAEINPLTHVIDCDAFPCEYDCWDLVSHQKGGSLTWDSKRFSLFVHELQQKGNTLDGYAIRGSLKNTAGKIVLNANVLDYLLMHPRLIPDEWKERVNNEPLRVFFWGTIYCLKDSTVSPHYVRCLLWSQSDREWAGDYRRLDKQWSERDPAALWSE